MGLRYVLLVIRSLLIELQLKLYLKDTLIYDLYSVSAQ